MWDEKHTSVGAGGKGSPNTAVAVHVALGGHGPGPGSWISVNFQSVLEVNRPKWHS